MLWSGSAPLAAVRAGMWGLVMVAGVGWLAISWTVLRLDSIDVVRVAGPVILFGAGTEVLRALAGRRTWWLNAGMAVLFAVAGVVLVLVRDSSFATPAGLVGWYLMVRGVADVVIAAMTRDTDRIWGLLMVVGVLEAGLGFFSASPLSRTADLLVVVLGGLALLRAVADVVTALRLREVRVGRADLLHLPPERAAGLAGYSAGLADYGSAPLRGRPRHRATPGSAVAGLSALSAPGGGFSDAPPGQAGDRLADAGPGPAASGRAADPASGRATEAEPGRAADSASGRATEAEPGRAADPGSGRARAAAGRAGDPESGEDAAMWPGGPRPAASEPAPAVGGMPTAGYTPGAPAGGSFHEEVLRTTADLDAMLAHAGVTGPRVPGYRRDAEVPEVPDTPEGVEPRAHGVTGPAAARRDVPSRKIGN